MIFLIYIIGILAFYLWDACIGWGVEFNNIDAPPLFLAAMVWFISIPVLMIYNFIRVCNHLRDNRIERQERDDL